MIVYLCILIGSFVFLTGPALLGLGLSLVWPAAIVLAWFVPLGLVFAALTDSCMMGMLLAKLPWNRGTKADCLIPKGN